MTIDLEKFLAALKASSFSEPAMSSIIIDEMVRNGRASKWQKVLCWLGTAHYYFVDMAHYKHDYNLFLADRHAWKLIQYKCRFCDKIKGFY